MRGGSLQSPTTKQEALEPWEEQDTPPLPSFKVDDDGNDSDGKDSNGNGDGNGDDAAAATNGDDVNDNNSGILSTAIGGERGQGAMQHNATINQTRGAQQEAEA